MKRELMTALAIAASITIPPAVADDAAQAAPGVVATDLQIAYQVDPRLTRGSYMGDRWVSPPTYTRVVPQPGTAIKARTQWFDAAGRPIAVLTEWLSDDPSVVTVTQGPSHGEIELVVSGGGTAAVEAISGSSSKRIVVESTQRSNGSLLVKISRDGDGDSR